MFVGKDKVTPKLIVQCGAYYAILFKEHEGGLLQKITNAAEEGYSKMLVSAVIVGLYIIDTTGEHSSLQFLKSAYINVLQVLHYPEISIE